MADAPGPKAHWATALRSTSHYRSARLSDYTLSVTTCAAGAKGLQAAHDVLTHRSMSVPMTTRMFAAALVVVLTRSISAQENQPYEPVYRAWAEGGVMLPQSTELHSFPGASGASKLTLHPGFRVGLGSGYEFTPYFALDWEIAVLAA